MNNNAAEKILLVEDSVVFSKVISEKLVKELGFECILAKSYKEAREILEGNSFTFFAAILDLVLPDAQDGEIVDYVLSKKIPSIILTGQINDDIREKIITKNVLDYIVKEGAYSLEQLIKVLRRIKRNKNVSVLVVDDSRVSRHAIKAMLESHNFNVFEAENGEEALSVLSGTPDIKLVVSDYHMPVMDGFTLISKIRQKYHMDEMAVIGISAMGNPLVSAQFLKKGCNDFIIKPFAREEFLCRINQNMEMLDYIEDIRNAAVRDYLSGLYNRRFFFDVGAKLFENAKRENISITIAAVDIDHFKRINDKYGHHAGDVVIKDIAKIMQSFFRTSDIIARMGGEEFCIIATNMKKSYFNVFDDFRKKIEEQRLSILQGELTYTVSIGVVTDLDETFEETIKKADELLYKAKNSGRNIVVTDSKETTPL